MTRTVHRVSEDDLGACAQLYCSVFNGEPWHDSWIVETARRRLNDVLETPGFRGFAAVRSDQLVACAMGYLEQWYSGEHFYLKEMFVEPELQRRGIGTELLEHLVTELRSEDVERVYLLTMTGGPANAFYEKAGFERNDRMGMQAREL